MKKLAWFLAFVLMLSATVLPVSAESTYGEAPMLTELVEAGELPPIEERLPEDPRVATDFSEDQLIPTEGTYGGTLRLVSNVVNWNPDIFVSMTENLLDMQSMNSDIIAPNLVAGYETNDDMSQHTFTLRKGLKWSDGTPVTMEDFRFTIENIIFNPELTPVITTWMTVDGTPFEFEILDDWTFRLTFPGPYGSLSTFLSMSGFNGYADLLKPAEYLKPFHKDFAEEIHGSLDAYYDFLQPFGTVMGYDDVREGDNWTYVFNQVDVTTWEITDPTDCLTSKYFAGLIDKDFPVLYPWIMVSDENNVQTWSRNPYYHKVDTFGNQLPYIDGVRNTLVESVEMTQMQVITGEVDFLRESATVDNITLYRENQEAAHIDPVLCMQGNTPTDFVINTNYGLNVDGTVKDDPDSQAWQEVASDLRFRQAVAMSFDAEEILETIYKDLGAVREGTLCTHDIDGANALLDEMGMVDVDGDGYRDTPSGKHFEFQIWNAAEATDILPALELYTEYLSEIGIKATGNTVESTLLNTSISANEVPARVIWSTFSILWVSGFAYDIGNWAPMWAQWYNAGCPDPATVEGEYLIPDEEGQEVIRNLYNMMTYSPEEVMSEIRPQVLNYIDSNCFIIRPLEYVDGIVVVNDHLRNIPQDVVTHSMNYYVEDMYFED